MSGSCHRTTGSSNCVCHAAEFEGALAFITQMRIQRPQCCALRLSAVLALAAPSEAGGVGKGSSALKDMMEDALAGMQEDSAVNTGNTLDA